MRLPVGYRFARWCPVVALLKSQRHARPKRPKTIDLPSRTIAATQARSTHGSMPLGQDPGGCSNRLSPRTLDEAISAFAAAGSAARIMAGGTDLLVQMRSGAVRPGLIVDIKKIAEITTIEETAEGGFRVGAAVPGAALAEHPRFGKVWPGVLAAVNLIGSTQVQGRASAGGNLCNGSPAGDSVPAMIAAGAIVTLQGPN